MTDRLHEILIGVEPQFGRVSIIARLLKDLTCGEVPMTREDQESVCWLVDELSELGESLIKTCEDMYAARKATANQL